MVSHKSLRIDRYEREVKKWAPYSQGSDDSALEIGGGQSERKVVNLAHQLGLHIEVEGL